MLIRSPPASGPGGRPGPARPMPAGRMPTGILTRRNASTRRRQSNVVHNGDMDDVPSPRALLALLAEPDRLRAVAAVALGATTPAEVAERAGPAPRGPVGRAWGRGRRPGRWAGWSPAACSTARAAGATGSAPRPSGRRPSR